MVCTYELAEEKRHLLEHPIDLSMKVVKLSRDVNEHRNCVEAQISWTENLSLINYFLKIERHIDLPEKLLAMQCRREVSDT